MFWLATYATTHDIIVKDNYNFKAGVYGQLNYDCKFLPK